MLDREERAYLRAHGKLRVLVVANERPYAYLNENGELAGAMKVVTDRLASDLGIEIEPLTYTDYESAYQAMQDGKADFLLNMFVDPEWGAERGLDQTAPFMTSEFTAVTRRAGLPHDPVIATLDNRLAKELIQQHFPGREIQTYPTIEACLEAVRQKKADVTYIRASSAQYQTMRGGYPDLVASGHISLQKGIAMAVPKTGDPVLLRILDKEIRHMGDGGIEAFYAEENCSPSLPSRSSPSSRSGGIVRCGMKMKRTCRASSIMTMRRACTMRSGSNARERRSSRATAWGHRSVLSSSCASCGRMFSWARMAARPSSRSSSGLAASSKSRTTPSSSACGRQGPSSSASRIP